MNYSGWFIWCLPPPPPPSQMRAFACFAGGAIWSSVCVCVCVCACVLVCNLFVYLCVNVCMCVCACVHDGVLGGAIWVSGMRDCMHMCTCVSVCLYDIYVSTHIPTYTSFRALSRWCNLGIGANRQLISAGTIIARRIPHGDEDLTDR